MLTKIEKQFALKMLENRINEKKGNNNQIKIYNLLWIETNQSRCRREDFFSEKGNKVREIFENLRIELKEEEGYFVIIAPKHITFKETAGEYEIYFFDERIGRTENYRMMYTSNTDIIIEL